MGGGWKAVETIRIFHASNQVNTLGTVIFAKKSSFFIQAGCDEPTRATGLEVTTEAGKGNWDLPGEDHWRSWIISLEFRQGESYMPSVLMS